MSNQLPGATGPLQGVPALGKEITTDILRIVRVLSDGTVVVSGTVAISGGTITVTGPLETTSSPWGTLIGGTKNVAAAATPEALGASTAIKGVRVQAKETNTDDVRVGPTGAEVFVLSPKDSIWIAIDNLADVFIDVDVDGEGVYYLALQT